MEVDLKKSYTLECLCKQEVVQKNWRQLLEEAKTE